jgi:tetratricopeptide (TPR) repeat protein
VRSFLSGPALLVALLPAMAACSAGGLTRSGNGDIAPGIDSRRDSEDGLIVGHRLMEAGQYELALRAYYRAAGKDGLNVDILSALGSANLKLGRLGQAEQLLRRALDEDPTFVPALNNLGCVLMEKGQAGEARVVFQQAYALDSGDSDSIRENLRLAIAQSESALYDTPKEKPAFNLVRRGQGRFVLLSQL